jgi:hypothetical protein
VSDTIFHPIFDGSLLTRAVIKTLHDWFPTYIQEIEHQRGLTRGKIPPPRTYAERWRFDSYPDDQMPAVIVICPGMARPPLADGDGVYHGWWSVGIGIIAAANTEDNSERLAKIYGAAARGILTQKSYLDNSWEFSGCEVEDETYRDVPDMEQARTMRAAQIVCRVFVENMYNKYGGPQYPIPPDPDTQPGSEWPEVESAFTEVKRLEEV